MVEQISRHTAHFTETWHETAKFIWVAAEKNTIAMAWFQQPGPGSFLLIIHIGQQKATWPYTKNNDGQLQLKYLLPPPGKLCFHPHRMEGLASYLMLIEIERLELLGSKKVLF